jgi:hypothetical protein
MTTLAITRSGAGSGTVTSSPGGIACPGACSASFSAGTAITLTATPAAGSRPAGWSGACTGSGASCQVTLSSASTVTAIFELVPLHVWGVTVRPSHGAGHWSLHIGLRVNRPASVRVSVARGDHVIATRRITLATGARSVLVALPRRARGGRYTIRIVPAGADADARVTRTVSLPLRR